MPARKSRPLGLLLICATAVVALAAGSGCSRRAAADQPTHLDVAAPSADASRAASTAHEPRYAPIASSTSADDAEAVALVRRGLAAGKRDVAALPLPSSATGAIPGSWYSVHARPPYKAVAVWVGSLSHGTTIWVVKLTPQSAWSIADVQSGF